MSNFQVAFKYTTLATLITVLSVSGIGINSKVWGQTIDEQEEEIEKLKNQNEIEELNRTLEEKKKATAEAEKARIEAERAKAEASLPNIDSSKAPKGTISADEKVKFENQILAYQAMNRIMEVVTEEIQAEIVDKQGSKISLVVFDEKVIPAALAQLDYKLFKARVNSIERDYQEFIATNRKDTNSGVAKLSLRDFNNAATASFLLEFLPFFRVNKTFKGTSVDLTTKAFVAKLTSKLRESGKSNISVYYPAEYPLITEDAIQRILQDINNLDSLRHQAKNIRNLTEEKINELKEINKSFDELVAELTNKNTGKSIWQGIASSLSLQLIEGSDPNKIIEGSDQNNKNKIYFLSVKITAGGTNRTSQTFLRNRLRHSGGVIVEYIVYDRNASIVLSNVHNSYTGFTKVPNSK